MLRDARKCGVTKYAIEVLNAGELDKLIEIRCRPCRVPPRHGMSLTKRSS